MIVRDIILASVFLACACGPHATSGARSTKDAPFAGNQAVSTEALLTHLETCQADGEKLEICLIGAYYDRGYIHVKIGEGDSPPQKIQIQEGLRFRFGKVTVTDKDRASEAGALGDPAALRDMASFSTGDWFNRSQVKSFVDELKKHYQAAGFGSVIITPYTRQDTSRQIVNLDVSIARGGATPAP